jgi:hypothetical protein
MERDQLPRTNTSRKFESLPIGAVTPADATLVLVVGILGIMDQEIAASREVISRDPLGLPPPVFILVGKEPARMATGWVLPYRKGERRLMIGQIDGTASVRLDAIA